MNLEENRRETFKDWPFREDCACTPEKMAEAGFYHCPTDCEPDLVCCYVCLKELDGWQPEDDPWQEHKSHASSCPFVILGKPEAKMTFEEFFKLDCQRYASIYAKNGENFMNTFLEAFEANKKAIHEIVCNRIRRHQNGFQSF